MKLEVGMYVRTKWGINKINEYVPQNGQLYLKNDVCVKSNVIKASHNIIDLIEVGDYVNEMKVFEIKEHLHNDKEIVLSNGKFQWSFSKNESDYDIKSIVTKEQFERMSYKVEE